MTWSAGVRVGRVGVRFNLLCVVNVAVGVRGGRDVWGVRNEELIS